MCVLKSKGEKMENAEGKKFLLKKKNIYFEEKVFPKKYFFFKVCVADINVLASL